MILIVMMEVLFILNLVRILWTGPDAIESTNQPPDLTRGLGMTFSVRLSVFLLLKSHNWLSSYFYPE